MDNNAILTEILERLSQMEKMLSHHQSNWFKIEEAAEYTKFSKRQLHRWINEGILKTKKINGGRKILIHKKWLDNVIMFGKSERLSPSEKKELLKLEEE